VKKWILFLFIFFLTAGSTTAGRNMKKHPGYVDLSGINLPSTDGAINSLEIPMISGTFNGDQSLRFSLNIKTCHIDDTQIKKACRTMEKISKKLKRKDWIPVVKTRGGDQYTDVRMKVDKNTNQCLGVMIMTLDPDNEATFVNIAGSIPLDGFRDLNLHVQDDVLDSLENGFYKYCEEDD